MGINKENLLSDEHHASHFSCAICQDLSESPVTLACSHVFCEFCIGEYVARCLDRQQNALCPTCRASDCSSAAKLSEANPLAFRCYAKVQTRCPLHKQGCAWTGDLGSLPVHKSWPPCPLGVVVPDSLIDVRAGPCRGTSRIVSRT